MVAIREFTWRKHKSILKASVKLKCWVSILKTMKSRQHFCTLFKKGYWHLGMKQTYITYLEENETPLTHRRIVQRSYLAPLVNRR